MSGLLPFQPLHHFLNLAYINYQLSNVNKLICKYFTMLILR